jgi:hypothetical protein
MRTLLLIALAVLGAAGACATSARDDSCAPRPAIGNRGSPATVRLGDTSITIAAYVITDSEPPYSNATFVRLGAGGQAPVSASPTLDSTFTLVCASRELSRGRVVVARRNPLFAGTSDQWFEVGPVPAVSWWKGSYDLQLRMRGAGGPTVIARIAPLELGFDAFRDTVARGRERNGFGERPPNER